MIKKKEVDDALKTALDLGMGGSDEETDEWRMHLCSFIISGTKDAFMLKIAFDIASWINNRKLRNDIWLYAIQKGTKIFDRLDRNSKDYLKDVGYLDYMDQTFKHCAHR